MWFSKLMGYSEDSPEQVRENTVVEGNRIISKINQKSYTFGSLAIPSLEELRAEVKLSEFEGKISVDELIADVQLIYEEAINEHAFFQVASQFNLLEMVDPTVTPEEGVGIYEYDKTQGPISAMACGAGTIYRNYFVSIHNSPGQTESKQIDCLADLGRALGNETLHLWEMQNGYALASAEGLEYLSKKLNSLALKEREALKGKLRVGLQKDTEVTLNNCQHLVTQCYCSALPVAYSHVSSKLWEPFARLILEASYEATLYAALQNYLSTGCNKVFLTLIGGGAFGNEIDWILEALEKAIIKFKITPLDIKIVSYGESNPYIQEMIQNKL